MKNKLDITLEIDGKFGSDFQKEFATDALALLLNSWAEFCENRHKKNKIEMWIDGKDAKYNWPR